MKGLVNLKKYGFVLDISKRKDWSKSKNIWVRKSVAEALIKAKEMLPGGYNFKIWDGKRSVDDQRRIIKLCEEDLKRRYPKTWEKVLVDFAGGYQSLTEKLPKNTHRHGGAVDLTIVDSNRKELDMGGDTLDKREALNYYERKNNLSKREIKIKNNRRLLKKIMKRAGFEPHFPEWAHWGFSK